MVQLLESSNEHVMKNHILEQKNFAAQLSVLILKALVHGIDGGLLCLQIFDAALLANAAFAGSVAFSCRSWMVDCRSRRGRSRLKRPKYEVCPQPSGRLLWIPKVVFVRYRMS